MYQRSDYPTLPMTFICVEHFLSTARPASCAGSTPVTICGLDIRPSPLPFPGDLVIAFLRALFAAEHLHTLRVAWNFGDRELLHDIAHVLKARTAAGAEGLEVLALEGIRGRLTKNTWAAVFALLDGDRCRIRKVR